jgi:hypothetical protein
MNPDPHGFVKSLSIKTVDAADRFGNRLVVVMKVLSRLPGQDEKGERCGVGA